MPKLVSRPAAGGQAAQRRAPIADCARATGRIPAPGFCNLSKPKPKSVERIVEELMDRNLTKEERIRCLRELARSGEDVPDELMDQALRKLMERITE
ncbi:MAG: hypothetical protein JNL08_04285 [Planctomycetes bacterium]|nr:hypothetical protein [Planctomycetota bacterium]